MDATHLFVHMIWAAFCTLKFSAYENTEINMILTISRQVLQFVCFPVRNVPNSGIFSAACVSLAASCCHSVDSALHRVVSVLNSQAIQSMACISAAKYEHLAFFWKPC